MRKVANKNKGFALLESVMSAVVIGGFVTSLQNAEADKQSVSEALALSKASQMAVVEYFNKNGTLPTSNTQINLPNKDNVANIKLSEFGEIIITMANSPAISDKTIVLEPNIKEGTIDWSCSNGSLDNFYRPKNCYKDPITSAENQEKLDSMNDGNYI